MIDIDRKTETLCQILAQEFYLTSSKGQGGRWGGGGGESPRVGNLFNKAHW